MSTENIPLISGSISAVPIDPVSSIIAAVVLTATILIIVCFWLKYLRH